MKYLRIVLKVVLFFTGPFLIFTGLNIEMGGLKTLEWQDQAYFFAVANQDLFSVQEIYIRFVGAAWTCTGLMFMQVSTKRTKIS